MSDYLKKGRIVNVNSTLKEDLSNIAKNLGETKSAFLRKKIREKMAKYPDEFKNVKIVTGKSAITVTGISNDLKNQIEITAGNLGPSTNAFMLFMLNEIASDYPESMKQPRID